VVTLEQNHASKKQKSDINAHRKYTTRNPIFIGFIWWEMVIKIKISKKTGKHWFLLVTRWKFLICWGNRSCPNKTTRAGRELQVATIPYIV